MTAPTATRPGTAASTKRWRTVLVWLHALTSFVWMSQALALSTVVGAAVVTADADFRVAVMDVAVLLDNHLLAPFGNASAFTGFVLAAATPWGFFRHRWVLTKFVITVVQLNVGIFVLSSGLHRAQQVAATGAPIGWWPSVVGGALMASAIAFQGWLSLAKPWGKTRWAATRGPRKLPTATTVVFVSSVVAVRSTWSSARWPASRSRSSNSSSSSGSWYAAHAPCAATTSNPGGRCYLGSTRSST